MNNEINEDLNKGLKQNLMNDLDKDLSKDLNNDLDKDLNINIIKKSLALNIIKPLDIIAFRGDDFISDLISFCQIRKLKILKKIKNIEKNNKKNIEKNKVDTTFSHVGIVISSEIVDDPLLEHGKLYIFESTMSGRLGSNIYSVHNPNKSFLGTQVRPLEELLFAYDKDNTSYIAWCPLKNPPENMYTDTFKQNFTNIYTNLNNRMYNVNPISLFGTLFSCLRKPRDTFEDFTNTNKWMFCSELVTEIYKNINVLPNTIISNNVVPMDLLGYDDEENKNEQISKDLIKETIYLV